MQELDNSKNLIKEINTVIKFYNKNNYNKTEAMAFLLFLKGKYLLYNDSFNENIKDLLLNSLKLFKKFNSRNKYISEISSINSYIGTYYALHNKYKLAEKYLNRSINIGRKNNLYQTILYCNKVLSIIYQEEELYSLAIDKLEENKNIIEQNNLIYDININYNLANLYIYNYEINKFYKIYQQISNKKYTYNYHINKIKKFIDAFKKTEQYKEGIKFIKSIINNLKDFDKKYFYLYIGDLYQEINNIEQSKVYYKKAKNLFYKETKDNSNDIIYKNYLRKNIQILDMCINNNKKCIRTKYVICKVSENNKTFYKTLTYQDCKQIQYQNFKNELYMKALNIDTK